MKAQRVDMFVCPSATPADTSGLQELADAGKLKPDTLVALVGKTEGTGAHDDWGRVWADVALREWTARFLGVPVDEVSRHVIFVLSGGCPGVITPHVAAVTREWVEVPEQRSFTLMPASVRLIAPSKNWRGTMSLPAVIALPSGATPPHGPVMAPTVSATM